MDALSFFPTFVPFPKKITVYYLRQTSKDSIAVLTAPPISTTPSLKAGDETSNGLLKLEPLFNTANNLVNPTPTTENVQSKRILKKKIHFRNKR